MSNEAMREFERERSLQSSEVEEVSETTAEQTLAVSPVAASAMLGGQMSKVQRRALVQNVAENFGNKQVQRMLGTVNRSASSGPEGGSLEQELADAVQSERGRGASLPESTRSTIESNLGQDMSQLKVSVNSDLNQAMGARAFTSGQNVVLRDTADLSDISLLTHEATHAIQQGFSTTRPTSIGAADTEHEQAAERNATNVGSANGVQRHAESDEAVQREAEEEELQMKRDETVQREAVEEEEPLQG
ncbi:DUF4157 domain-containing protein [Candidatus Chlorohelix sp.]|uniref:eCIS core domain-containing protein n=1 Tax=Candidatus Chlorohelix sp. TaxID=3139201 RepID=UPI00304D410C